MQDFVHQQYYILIYSCSPTTRTPSPRTTRVQGLGFPRTLYPQRLQYPLIKEYSLNNMRDPTICNSKEYSLIEGYSSNIVRDPTIM